MKRILTLVALPAAFLLGACADDCCGSIACTEEARAGITVQVTDARSGAFAAEGATLTLRDGQYEEIWTDAFGGQSLSGAWERAGTYDAEVAKEGYHTWTQSGIQVDADECHVIPVALHAPLEPVALHAALEPVAP